MNIRTVTLDGAELRVEGLNGQNTAIINKSDNAVYASVYPNIEPEGDNVIEIPSGGHDGLYNTNGTLYLLGTGKVELRGTDYAVNFRQPSRSTDGGGSKPSTETMPHMDGVSGYFLVENADGRLWRNQLLLTDVISFTNDIVINEDAAHIHAGCSGNYYGLAPRIIYLVLKSNGISTNSTFGSTVFVLADRLKFMYLKEARGGGFGFSDGSADIVINPPPKLSTEYQVVALAIDGSQISLFIDGEKLATTTISPLSDTTLYNTKFATKKGSSIDSDGDYNMRFYAFGVSPHTDEQIKANSEWLMKKYLGGD